MLYPYYLIVYNFRMPEKPFVDETIQFHVDSNGTIVSDEKIMGGIPDIVHNPAAVNFTIDEKQAREIARNAGLEQGISDWHASFGWGGSAYVWSVQNTLQETDGLFQSYSAHGKTVIIDAISGQVLQTSEWSAIS
ncbi:MAG: hypothetical protein NWF01_11155 [Candidatus Bathyarchaeota archaeon]|nr:hypothetical protein [Candidatus Bathyarchaeota archaeon]